MYTAKHAMLIRDKYPDTKVHVFYIDVRTPGKNFDEFYRRAVEEYGVDYIKGMVGKVAEKDGKLLVQGSDLISNEQVLIEADLVVLATAIEPDPSVKNLATMLTASIDTNNFLTEAHPKLRPVESPTAGVYLSGVCQGPKDIPETVAQASAAAAKVIGLLRGFRRAALQRLLAVRERMPLRRDRLYRSGSQRSWQTGSPQNREGQRGDLSGLRRVHRNVPFRRNGSERLYDKTNYGGGRCDMQIEENNKEFKPLIVAFCCNWCSYAGADLAGSSRLSYPANVKVIRVPCSCRVNPLFILRAFQRGADGVIIAGCHPGDCHYTSGNYYARRRMTLLFSMLDYLGIEKERTRVEWISAAEGAKFSATMNEFVTTIHNLGENKKLEDLRCKE